MPSERDREQENNAPQEIPNYQVSYQVFNKVVEELIKLNSGDRQRVISALQTFFGLHHNRADC